MYSLHFGRRLYMALPNSRILSSNCADLGKTKSLLSVQHPGASLVGDSDNSLTLLTSLVAEGQWPSRRCYFLAPCSIA
jgi:hypothetical protein|tara:strand:- start:393 stop:626 length:234 start_codon:yes stop_codon:yes gene_type:complete